MSFEPAGGGDEEDALWQQTLPTIQHDPRTVIEILSLAFATAREIRPLFVRLSHRIGGIKADPPLQEDMIAYRSLYEVGWMLQDLRISNTTQNNDE